MRKRLGEKKIKDEYEAEIKRIEDERKAEEEKRDQERILKANQNADSAWITINFI